MSVATKREEFGSFASDQSKLELLKRTMGKDLSNDELELFGHVCKRTGLDPFVRQIYPVKRKDKMTIQTGIDGFRAIAERTGRYSPGREPSYAYDTEGRIISSTAHIRKQTDDGTWHEVAATAFWAEYAQTNFEGKPTQFWAKMPHLMLAKCAEALCLRKAFPSEMSGVYTEEEMSQASNGEAAGTPRDSFMKKPDLCVEPIKSVVRQSEFTLDYVKMYIQERGGDLDLLEAFIKYRAEESKRSKEDVISSATLNQDMVERFQKAYSKWLSEMVIE